jgi:hypothetical protein
LSAVAPLEDTLMPLINVNEPMAEAISLLRSLTTALIETTDVSMDLSPAG